MKILFFPFCLHLACVVSCVDCSSHALLSSQLFVHFKKGDKAPAQYGRGRDWNVDLIPKFLMADGMCVRVRSCVCVCVHVWGCTYMHACSCM